MQAPEGRPTGLPDLFLIRKGQILFLEVKTETDAIRADQYHFIEDFLSIVSDDIAVARVLPSEYRATAGPLGEAGSSRS